MKKMTLVLLLVILSSCSRDGKNQLKVKKDERNPSSATKEINPLREYVDNFKIGYEKNTSGGYNFTNATEKNADYFCISKGYDKSSTFTSFSLQLHVSEVSSNVIEYSRFITEINLDGTQKVSTSLSRFKPSAQDEYLNSVKCVKTIY